MKKSKVPKGKGRVLICACEPPRRRLKNGDILTAVSTPAKQEWDPFAVVDELEKEWRRG